MSIAVRHPGLFTTVQDLGRAGWQHLGVPVGGAMDPVAHRIANLLVGNADDAAALECTLGGIALQFEAPALVALAGRDVTASVDGHAVPAWHPVMLRRGALLALHTGCRTTIAVAGGIDVPEVLGARGTSLRAGFGGLDGRALRRDDRLRAGIPSPLGTALAAHLEGGNRMVATFSAGRSLRPAYGPAPVVRMIPGPEFELLTFPSRTALLGDSFGIAPDSDRMGFRLAGPSLALSTMREMLSSGVTAGTIQLPPGGAPIVLMADRQTTGGYARLGDVITVDLPLLAQLRPGDAVRFAHTTLDAAHTLYRQREHDLAGARRGMQLRAAAEFNDAG